MSYCLNPNCLSPRNPENAENCQQCQSRLLLNDRYRPLDPIGRGGFGRTFKAIDEYKPSKPNCVIKQFHGKGFDDAAKAEELFNREAELQEKLGKHSQIPELLALCPQDNYLYLVQEFIDGRNLNQELKEEGTFSEDKIWQLLKDLLPVLQFIHDNQVIHRDIKPENIIRHSAEGRLFLVDFGIAKLATEAILAKTGTVIGSEGYTAPEQHEGKPSFASDLYSLGATCYHFLTRADPSRLLYSWVDWQKELRDKLENRDISEELIEVLTKLLQPDVSQRYQSAEEVIQDLNLEPTKATAESPLIFPTSELKPATQSWRCVNTLVGHRSDVCTVAISPDSRILASGATDHHIKIWDLHTEELLQGVEQLAGDVYSLAFSPNGETLVSAGWASSSYKERETIQKTVLVWHLSTMEVLLPLLGHFGSVCSVAISPDGQTLASGGGDKTIKLWDLHSGKLIKTLSGHSKGVCSVAVSPDGQTLASGSQDKTIKLWNLPSRKLIDTLRGHSESVHAVAISPDSQILASGSEDNTVKLWKLWNIAIRQPLRILSGHSGRVNSIAFSPDGQILASGSKDATIRLWHVETGKWLCTLEGESRSEKIRSVAFSPDGQILASGIGGGMIKIWRRD